MVDNLAEKVDKCWGCYVLFAYNWDHKHCPLYGVVGCPLIRVLVLKYMEGQSGLSELSVILWVSSVEGCPLSTFFLDSHRLNSH